MLKSKSKYPTHLLMYIKLYLITYFTDLEKIKLFFMFFRKVLRFYENTGLVSQQKKLKFFPVTYESKTLTNNQSL